MNQKQNTESQIRLDEIHRRLAEYEASKITIDEYRNAVQKLVAAAFTDTHGGQAAAGVLLGCYNSWEFHLDVSDLCMLDIEHYRAALNVIRGRVEHGRYPDDLIENSEVVFGHIWEKWECLKITNRAKAG